MVHLAEFDLLTKAIYSGCLVNSYSRDQASSYSVLTKGTNLNSVIQSGQERYRSLQRDQRPTLDLCACACMCVCGVGVGGGNYIPRGWGGGGCTEVTLADLSPSFKSPFSKLARNETVQIRF